MIVVHFLICKLLATISREGKLLYRDKKRSMEWVEKNKSFNGERTTKLQLLGKRLTDIETSNINILTKERLVNFSSSSLERGEYQSYQFHCLVRR